MKTELYKMWLEFCRSKDVAMARESYEDDGRKTGYVAFDYKHDFIQMACPSPAYDAWRAFMLAKDPRQIIRFIVKNFTHFKDHFPATCVFFDLHGIEDPHEVLLPKHQDLVDELANVVYKDASLVDERKKARNV